jgi:hypothetical protein
MIALSRADARRFRAVARRGCPNGRPKGPSPPVRVTAAGERLTLACHLGEVIVCLRTTSPKPGKGTFIIPLDAFSQFEAASGVVSLEPGSDRQSVVANWEDGHAPRSIPIQQIETDRAWPAEPDRVMAMPPFLPKVLHEAGRSAARDDPGRYAVTRVQVRGKAGELAGTDGKQALVWGGFTFPFADDLLVPAVPLFGSKELAGEAAVSIGLGDEWLYLVIGPWQVWLWVDREGKFPDVRGAAPRNCPTHVTIDDKDVDTLLRELSELPGGQSEAQPVTLNLGEQVVVRSRDDQTGNIAQVRLPDSTSSGPPIRVVVGRDHLGRALHLGFRDLWVSTPERPIAFRDKDRLFLTATLDPALAVAPDGKPGADASVPEAISSPRTSTSTDERRIPVPTRDNGPPDRNGHPIPAEDPSDPLAEAEALRTMLADAATRAHQLVAALKQFRKERRALSAAFTSLKQLNLGP